MKKIFFLLVLVIGIVFSSCKKDNPPAPEITSLRYEFTSDVDANYNIKYTADTANNYEAISLRTWSKTILVAKNSVSTASLTVYPPAAWFGTTNQANATVKIFVNGEQKGSTSGLLVGSDRPPGITVSTTIQ